MSATERARVLVIGEALIDIVDIGGRRSEYVGGSPANVALGLGRRDVSVTLLTHIASDARGWRIAEHLEHSGVHVPAESMAAERTPTALARIDKAGHAEYEFDLEWDIVRVPSDMAPALVHTGSVAAFLTPGAGSVLALLRDTAAQEITFDPNIRPALVGSHDEAFATFEAVAQRATVVKMSDEDAGWLYPGLSPDDVLQRVLALGPRLVAMTLGSSGAILANVDSRAWIPGVKVDVVDTIGAGDTFMASLIDSVLERSSERLSREEITQIGRAAAQAAAITVSRAGADLPWLHELATH